MLLFTLRTQLPPVKPQPTTDLLLTRFKKTSKHIYYIPEMSDLDNTYLEMSNILPQEKCFHIPLLRSGAHFLKTSDSNLHLVSYTRYVTIQKLICKYFYCKEPLSNCNTAEGIMEN